METLTLQQKKDKAIEESRLALEQTLKEIELEETKEADTIKIKGELEDEKKKYEDARAKKIAEFESKYNTVLFPAPTKKAKRKKSTKPKLSEEVRIQMAIDKGYKMDEQGYGLVNSKGEPMNTTINLFDENKVKHTLSANVLSKHLTKRE